MREFRDNFVVIHCTIENFDPMDVTRLIRVPFLREDRRLRTRIQAHARCCGSG